MSADSEIEDSSAPLIEHLAELRTRLIRSVVAFLIGMVLCFSVGGMILDFLLGPIETTMRNLGNPNPVMQYTAPQEYFLHADPHLDGRRACLGLPRYRPSDVAVRGTRPL